jgi:hypothetical protein
MPDLRMPEGLSEAERQQWLEALGRQLADETGQPSGVVEQQVPGGQPVWAMWWTDEPNPSVEGTTAPPTP